MYVLHIIEIILITALIVFDIMLISAIDIQSKYDAESSAIIQRELQSTIRILRQKGILEDLNK